MNTKLNKTANQLAQITTEEIVDWNKFDTILGSINFLNDIDDESSLLSLYLESNDHFQNGKNMPEAIRHFIKMGFDVNGNSGRNGTLALTQLCWSSYDKYILGCAKVLLAAGAKIEYVNPDDSDDDDSLISSLEWKLPGAWHSGGDFEEANIFEAFYAIAQAYKDNKDYTLISSYHDCLGKSLCRISVPKGNIAKTKALTKYSDYIVLWFDSTPLVISHYVDLVVNPLAISSESAEYEDITDLNNIINKRLQEVLFINTNTCFLSFDGGYGILITSQLEDGKRIGCFEVTAVPEDKFDFGSVKIDGIYKQLGINYSSTCTNYAECSLAIKMQNDWFILFANKNLNTQAGCPYFELIKCSVEFLKEFAEKLPIESFAQSNAYHDENGHLLAVTFSCINNEFLYLKASDDTGIEFVLTKEIFNPMEKNTFSFKEGRQIKFTRTFEDKIPD